jgi:AraC-like DNA-binding protein
VPRARSTARVARNPVPIAEIARVDRAKELLASNDYSVTDVCMEVGFNSLGSFSDLFARRVGVPPSAYRRQIRSSVWPGGAHAITRTSGCLSLMAAAFALFEKHSPGPLSDSGACASR